MYDNQLMEANACTPKGLDVQRRNMTVRENIDSKISQLNAEVARLEASKGTLGPLLDMRIADIRDAMSY